MCGILSLALGPAGRQRGLRGRSEVDAEHGVSWRVIRTGADLADVDWIETRYGGYLERADVDDAARLQAILAEHAIGPP